MNLLCSQDFFLTKNFFDPLTVVSCLISNSTTFRLRLNVKLPINFGQPDSYLQSKKQTKWRTKIKWITYTHCVNNAWISLVVNVLTTRENDLLEICKRERELSGASFKQAVVAKHISLFRIWIRRDQRFSVRYIDNWPASLFLYQ